MASTISTSDGWLIGYDTKAEIWCGYHKDVPGEEWNAYGKQDLLDKIALSDDPNTLAFIRRQAVER
jgi:hypothetical protein